ncbi:hypothetical protein BC826DRAFT_972308 [Russula brevipes]|nr:hypothetical protein BC826DRAFT_972308 [Russula brevipes]
MYILSELQCSVLPSGGCIRLFRIWPWLYLTVVSHRPNRSHGNAATPVDTCPEDEHALCERLGGGIYRVPVQVGSRNADWLVHVQQGDDRQTLDSASVKLSDASWDKVPAPPDKRARLQHSPVADTSSCRRRDIPIRYQRSAWVAYFEPEGADTATSGASSLTLSLINEWVPVHQRRVKNPHFFPRGMGEKVRFTEAADKL